VAGAGGGYAPDSDGDGECGCGEGCECVERCACGGDCGCIHSEIVQEAGGKKLRAGSGSNYWPPPSLTQTNTGSGGGGTGGGNTGGGEIFGPCGCQFGGACLCPANTCECKKPEEKKEPIVNTLEDSMTMEFMSVQVYCRCGYGADCCGGVCIHFDDNGNFVRSGFECKCEVKTEDPKDPEGPKDPGGCAVEGCKCPPDTCIPGLCDCIDWDNYEQFCDWYGNWEHWDEDADDWDTAGDRAPSGSFDDPAMTAVNFRPWNIEEYAMFNRANRGKPPAMDKTLLVNELMGKEIILHGDSTVLFNYVLSARTYTHEYESE
jgi:hypothetical protein